LTGAVGVAGSTYNEMVPISWIQPEQLWQGAVEAGADLVNDISGATDMLPTVAQLSPDCVDACVGHLRRCKKQQTIRI